MRGSRKEGPDTSKPRFAKMLPAQGKRKINSFYPKTGPPCRTIRIINYTYELYFNSTFFYTLNFCHKFALQSGAGILSAMQSLSRSGRLFHGATTREVNASSPNFVWTVRNIKSLLFFSCLTSNCSSAVKFWYNFWFTLLSIFSILWI